MFAELFMQVGSNVSYPILSESFILLRKDNGVVRFGPILIYIDKMGVGELKDEVS